MAGRPYNRKRVTSAEPARQPGFPPHAASLLDRQTVNPSSLEQTGLSAGGDLPGEPVPASQIELE